jgi:repressor LexA
MDPGKKRAISLPRPAPVPRSAGKRQRRAVPIVGTVAAGQPILAEQNIDGWLPWEGGEGWFALRVRGESMKNAGILPGDKVIVRPQPTAENGEIVVALLGDEATVKRLSRREGHVWLLPENEDFAPIDGDRAAILGTVRGVLRVYGE